MKKTLLLLLTIAYLNIHAQVEIVTDVSWPLGIVESNNFLYIVEADDNEISKIDLSSANPTPITVVNGLDRPNHLVVKDNFIYFTEYNGGTISKIDITQSNPTPIVVISGVQTPEDLVISGNDLYFTEYNQGTISKIDITQSNPTPTIILSGLLTPYGLEINGDDLYFSEYLGNSISKIDLTSATPIITDVISGLQGPLGGLVIIDTVLYFIEVTSNEIAQLDINSPSPSVTLIDDGYHAGDFAFVGNDMYVSDVQNGLILKYADQIVSTVALEIPSVSIFPNPSSDFVIIKGITEQSNCSIYNLLGMKIQEVVISNNYTLDISSFESGSYFFVFDDKWTKKIIKN